MVSFKRKFRKGYKNTIAFLKNPETHKKFLKGTKTVAKISSEWESGIDRVVGVPKKSRVNVLEGMHEGVERALPRPRKNLGRVVVRRPQPTIEKFW